MQTRRLFASMCPNGVFRSTFPTRQTFLADDYNWGIHAFDLPAGTTFDLTVVWQYGKDNKKTVLKGLKCRVDGAKNKKNKPAKNTRRSVLKSLTSGLLASAALSVPALRPAAARLNSQCLDTSRKNPYRIPGKVDFFMAIKLLKKAAFGSGVAVLESNPNTSLFP